LEVQVSGEKTERNLHTPAAPAKLDLGLTTQVDCRQITAARARENSEKQSVLTIIAGVEQGRIIPLDQRPLTVGRDPECGILLGGPGISRIHFLVEPGADDSFVICDLGSTNGIYVNGEKTLRHILSAGDRIHVGVDTVLRYSVENVTDVELRLRQYEQSIRDDLTGIYNRRHFISTLKNELAFGRRSDDHVSCVLFDIDDFKSINDQFGHTVGDVVIRTLATILTDQLRTEDVLARYGGEEFAAILRGQDEQGAFQTAERIRKIVEDHSVLVEDTKLSVTISLGTSTFCSSRPKSPEELIDEADHNLYKAKAEGKNRTVGAAMSESAL
jgi:diguanylate cyclase (GGDEF)-like protein